MVSQPAGIGGYTNRQSAEQVIRYIFMLRDVYGMSSTEIARQADISHTTVDYLRGQRDKRGCIAPAAVYRWTARRILAVQPKEPEDGGRRMPIHGTQRRIGAMLHAGYPLKFQAERIGWQKNNYWTILNQRKFVFASTWFAIARMYDELINKTSDDFGITIQSQRFAKTTATKGGWAPDSCWDFDTIDDPDGFANWTGVCGQESGRSVHKREGIPICPPCQAAQAAAQVERNARRKELKAGAEPVKRTGRPRGQGGYRWDDEALMFRLRADFETWTDIRVMEERYGVPIAQLRRQALRDGTWTHAHALLDRNTYGHVES